MTTAKISGVILIMRLTSRRRSHLCLSSSGVLISSTKMKSGDEFINEV